MSGKFPSVIYRKFLPHIHGITMKREARNQHHQKTGFTYETAYAEGVKANPVPFIIFYYYSYTHQISLKNLSGF